MNGTEIRQAILDQMSEQTLGTFAVSSELPWDAAGTPLYSKNFKIFYVSEPDETDTTTIPTLGLARVNTRETVISMFVTVDAKNPPANYHDLVESAQDLVASTAITGVITREVDVTTTFENDALLTEIEYRFSRLVLY